MKKVTKSQTGRSKKDEGLETLIDHDLLRALVSAIEEIKSILADQHLMISGIVHAMTGKKEGEA